MSRMHNAPHPGLVLREWLKGVGVTDAAAKLDITRTHLSRILNGRASAYEAEMALRLSAALGTSAEVWIGMQIAYDLWQAEQKPLPQIARMDA